MNKHPVLLSTCACLGLVGQVVGARRRPTGHGLASAREWAAPRAPLCARRGQSPGQLETQNLAGIRAPHMARARAPRRRRRRPAKRPTWAAMNGARAGLGGRTVGAILLLFCLAALNSLACLSTRMRRLAQAIPLGRRAATCSFSPSRDALAKRGGARLGPGHIIRAAPVIKDYQFRAGPTGARPLRRRRSAGTSHRLTKLSPTRLADAHWPRAGQRPARLAPPGPGRSGRISIHRAG